MSANWLKNKKLNQNWRADWDLAGEALHGVVSASTTSWPQCLLEKKEPSELKINSIGDGIVQSKIAYKNPTRLPVMDSIGKGRKANLGEHGISFRKENGWKRNTQKMTERGVAAMGSHAIYNSKMTNVVAN